MKSYKVHSILDQRKWVVVRAKSGMQAKKKASKWLKTQIEYLEEKRL